MYNTEEPPRAVPVDINQPTGETKGAEFTPRNGQDGTGNVINKNIRLTLNQDEATTEISDAEMPNMVDTEPKDQDLSDVTKNPPLLLNQVTVSRSTKNYIFPLRENFHGLIENFLEGIDRIIASRGGTAPMEASIMSCVVTIAFGDVDQEFKFTCVDKNPAIPPSAKKGMTDCGIYNCKVEYLGNGSKDPADGTEGNKGIAKEKGKNGTAKGKAKEGIAK